MISHPLSRHGKAARLTLKLCTATLLGPFATAAAQDIQLHVTYVCNGEHIYIEGCNIRDLSDTATCMVEHPDHVGPTGIAAITSETRGSLKKRLPTCQQPTAKELAAAQAFQKRQQEIYNANVQKANPQPNFNRAQPAGANASQQQIRPPKTPRSAPCAAASAPDAFPLPVPATLFSEPSAR
ncbi:hypothetical protein [Tunturiibacter gelidiferens]|uniref:hypothetical protein n=1 Tax=Tunturiibacter gelidiferens TaxID=3069689 RepID=UPI003D9B9625